MNTAINYPDGMTEEEFDSLCRFLEDPAEAKGSDKAALRLTPEMKRRVHRPAWYVGIPSDPESTIQL